MKQKIEAIYQLEKTSDYSQNDPSGPEQELKDMRNNKVNIDFLKEQVSKLQIDVEKLIRKNGAH